MRTVRTPNTFIDVMETLPNHRQSHPTHDRASYEHTRRWVRSLRRHSPTHMDVLWYANSLGIGKYDVWVTRRQGYSFARRQWETLPRSVSPRGWVGSFITTVGPLGRLP